MTKKIQGAKVGRPPIHGGYSLLTTGELPENRRYLVPYLTGVREGLIKDLGPLEADLTTAQKVLIDRVISYLGIVRLIEEHIKERGIFANPQGFLNPALAQNYLAYCGHIQRALQALGITTRQIGEPMDLGRYIQQKDQEEAAAKAKGTGKAGTKAQDGQVDRQGKGGKGKGKDQGTGTIDDRRQTSRAGFLLTGAEGRDPGEDQGKDEGGGDGGDDPGRSPEGS